MSMPSPEVLGVILLSISGGLAIDLSFFHRRRPPASAIKFLAAVALLAWALILLGPRWSA